jgi:hypothetical protein
MGKKKEGILETSFR